MLMFIFPLLFYHQLHHNVNCINIFVLFLHSVFSLANVQTIYPRFFVKKYPKYPAKSVMYKPSDHLDSSIVTVFNSLPKYIRSSNTASTFKKAPYHVFGLV